MGTGFLPRSRRRFMDRHRPLCRIRRRADFGKSVYSSSHGILKALHAQDARPHADLGDHDVSWRMAIS